MRSFVFVFPVRGEESKLSRLFGFLCDSVFVTHVILSRGNLAEKAHPFVLIKGDKHIFLFFHVTVPVSANRKGKTNAMSMPANAAQLGSAKGS